MQITASAISLNVDDVTTSATFIKQHFGFHEEMSADGFVSLSRPDAGFNLIFLRIGLETFKPIQMRGHRVDGLLIAFVVDDIDTGRCLVAGGIRLLGVQIHNGGSAVTIELIA